MWESPIYRFKTEVDGEETEILIDVTGSAPNFKEPGKQLEGTFDVLLAGLNPEKTKILDFGGAKLRNTLYLLEKGYTVYACEFEDLFMRSKQASEFYKKCEEYPNFKRLIFPNDFIDSDEKFDVILLINVLNIMPVPLERLSVLALCREKIADNGRLLWYTQHGAYSEENAVAMLNDGMVTGKGRTYHMFYRDFSRKEIHEMLLSMGFSYDKTYTFSSSGSNQAYLFRPEGPILIDSSLELIDRIKKKTNIEFEVSKRKSGIEDIKKYEAEVPTHVTTPEEIDILEEYAKELQNTKPGRDDAPKYHNLIFNILRLVFDGRLKKPKKEERIAEGTQRVDITFKNERTKGFFKQLSEGYKLVCPNIFIECKNYSEDLGNNEIFQIAGRLNKVRGQFGIVVCRTTKNKEKLRDRLNDTIKDGKYIIVLEDEDILKLIQMKLSGDEEEIDDYIEDKFKVLT